MARLCERPGCSQPAEVIYGIDAEHLLVWIESLDGHVAYRAGVLCRRHADAMVVPLGWMLDDRREAVPRLFKSRETPPPPPSRPRRQRQHAARDETGQLELSPAVEAAVAAEPAPVAAESSLAPAAADAAPAAGGGAAKSPWKPVFDQSDDLDGLLQARSPLLSRAFGKREQAPPAE
ncbi:MAG: hypothetical protein ABMA25_20825 [Ilumatobacteraceae bacterium]